MAARMLFSKESFLHLRASSLLSVERQVLVNFATSLHTSHSCLIDRRKDRAISQYLYYVDHHKTLKHKHTPLIERPDYSYTDGRLTELAKNQKQRQQKNYELTKQIIQFLDELKLAQHEFIANERQTQQANQKRINSALKVKGTDTI